MLNGEEYTIQYEKKMLDYLQWLINDLDRRIKRAKERLDAKPSDEILAIMKPNKDENEERIVKLELQMKDVLDRMEKYGEAGKVYEAQQLDCEAERLKRDIDRIKQVGTKDLTNRKLIQCLKWKRRWKLALFVVRFLSLMMWLSVLTHIMKESSIWDLRRSERN